MEAWMAARSSGFVAAGSELVQSFVLDMIVRKRIMQALNLAKDMLDDVKDGERWLQGWIEGRINLDLRAMEGQYGAKKAELDACRRDILARANGQLQANDAAAQMAGVSM
eukprot:gene5706-17603_t